MSWSGLDTSFFDYDMSVFASVINSVLTGIYFFLVAYIALYIPGSLIPFKNEKAPVYISSVFFRVGVGFVLWTIQGVVFGYMGARWLTYVYISVCATVYLRQYGWMPSFVLVRKSQTVFTVLAAIVFLVGIYGQVNRFVPSGFAFPQGIYMFTGASDDAFWHAALTSQLVRRFPPFEPGMANVPLRNYHYFTNLAIAEFVRVFHLPLMPAQFIFAPLLFSLLIGGLSYALAREMKIRPWIALLGVYLQYFASDVIYIITYITRGVVDFSVHPLEDGTMMYENPPRAASFIVLMIGILLLKRWIEKPSAWRGILTAVTLGIVIGFKVHTGLAVLCGMVGVGVYMLAQRKFSQLYVPILTAMVSAAVYLPVNRSAGFPIIVPFYMAQMFAAQKNIGIDTLLLRLDVYRQHGNALRIIQMNVWMLVLFLIGQFGIRTVGWLGIRKALREHPPGVGIFLVCTLIGSLLIGTLVIQPVAGADIFNMYLVTSFILWLLTLFVVAQIRFHPSIIVLCFIILFAVTLPRWVYKTQMDWSTIGQSKPAIPAEELQVFQFIKTNTDGKSVVAVFNNGQWDAMYPYVSIFTERDMYLSGQTILGRHGVPYEKRQEVINRAHVLSDGGQVRAILKEQGIDVVLFLKDDHFHYEGYADGIRRIYANGRFTVYQIE